MTKKQVLKIIIFISIVLWLTVHITYCLRINGDVKDRFVGFYAEKKNTIDVAILGSSPVYPCFETPRIYGEMGITAYPVSSHMQRPVATRYLVEEILKTQDPELFIFEMRMWTASDEDLVNSEENMGHTRGVTDNMKYSWNRIRTINAMIDKDLEVYDKNTDKTVKEHRYYHYFDIFKYHSNWRSLRAEDQRRAFMYEYPSKYKGFEFVDKVGPADKENHGYVTDSESIPPEQEQYLNELLDCLEKHNKKALFVVTPYTVEEHEQRRINYLSDLLKSKGYDFIDMNRYIDEIGFDETVDYSDGGIHTNLVGADKVTTWFMDYLKKNYLDTGLITLKDRREDKKCTSWDKSYEQWLKDHEAGVREVARKIANEEWNVEEAGADGEAVGDNGGDNAGDEEN